MSDTPNMPTLRDLIAGDKVVLEARRYGEGARSIVLIRKVTPSQIVVSYPNYEQRFNRDTGRLIGSDSYSSIYLRYPTPELVAEVCDENEKSRLVANLSRVNWPYHSLEVLRAVVACLPVK